MIEFLRRNWKVVAPLGVVGLAVVIWLAFFFFGIQYLIIDDKVDESGPVFASGAAVAESDDSPEPAEPEPDEPAEPAEPVEPAEPAAQVVTLVRGEFVDRSHPARGTALVLSDGTEQRFLRFEDFATDNGPDLNVYLSTAPADAPAGDFDDDFVDLGNLKGNIGDQNYEIPASVDLSVHRTVVIWCVRFAVAFGAADLA